MKRTAPTRPITHAEIDAICARLRKRYGHYEPHSHAARQMMADLIVIVREKTALPWDQIGMLLGTSFSHARNLYKAWTPRHSSPREATP